MRNLKLVVSYDGSDFHGWQMQPGMRTVQETLESALAALTGEQLRVNASGRTDTGVHARGQVVNFRSETKLAAVTLARALNTHLPSDVVVREAADVPEPFDANRDAKRKLYRYIVHDGPVPDLFMRRYCYHTRYQLDAPAMTRAAACLRGRHDFRSFETEWPNRASSVRTITHLAINRFSDWIWLDVEADGFLYNMVRAIAGTLINVGRGYWPEAAVAEILKAQDRAGGADGTCAGLVPDARELRVGRAKEKSMPLLDHFHPPLDRRSWESFHGGWGFQLSGQFNMRPNRYGFLAAANVHIGITVDADVAAFEEDSPSGDRSNGTVATEAWAPPQPPLIMPVDFSTLETFEIRIYDEDRARTLVAVVELISPGNKDRPESRRAFLDKCAAYLREGVSVVIVDIVTSRRHNFHAALMELFNCGEPAVHAVTADLYTVSYRVRLVGQRTQLEAWPVALALNTPLPTMPLWLTESLCVPLDLEAAYQAACRYAAIG